MALHKGIRGPAIAGLCVVTCAALAYVGGTGAAPDTAEATPSTGTVAARTAATASSSVASESRARAAATMPVALALDPSQAGADPYTVEPRVPRAAGTPCVVELTRNTGAVRIAMAEPFFYLPPAGCPGPWARVMLVVELTGERPPDAPSSNLQVTFTNQFTGGGDAPGTLFVGAPQEHKRLSVWRLERDVTEYAALLSSAQTGYLAASEDSSLSDEDYLPVGARAVKLVFWPTSTATPAARVPDAVHALQTRHWQDGSPRAEATLTLPRNIERAYLDVTAQALGGAQRFWYGCVPETVAQAYPTLRSTVALGDTRHRRGAVAQGCTGGSFREVEVRIDGQRAGLAPLFPWLPSSPNPAFADAIDEPAPGVQALNFMPYRVDLTPFAGLLNDGQPHHIEAVVVAGEPSSGSAFVSAQLLLYRDAGREILSGAVTRNTLAEQAAQPQIENTLGREGESVQGQLVTRSSREFVIDGYVDTSRGRIHSRVWQRSRFVNTQTFGVTGPDPAELVAGQPYKHDYLQKIRLSSTVDRVSVRRQGATVLAEDRGYVTYPLSLDYRHGALVWPDPLGDRVDSDLLQFTVHQGRGLRASHVRPGLPRYHTELKDVFDGSRGWRRVAADGSGVDSNWKSRRDYLFTDTRGGCYSAALTTADGELTTRTRGTACPGGRNALRWYSHPDGSPDGLGWMER